MILFVTLVGGWMVYIDGTIVNPPMLYDSTLLRTDRVEYAPGDVVSVYLDVSKLRDVPGRITWQLVNGRVFPYATRELRYPVGAYEKWYALESERLPTANLTEGDAYHYEALVEKDVNPLRTVTYKLRTVDFRIRSKE
jgi:hypothetical protein